jgi:hypothetical protein
MKLSLGEIPIIHSAKDKDLDLLTALEKTVIMDLLTVEKTQTVLMAIITDLIIGGDVLQTSLITFTCQGIVSSLSMDLGISPATSSASRLGMGPGRNTQASPTPATSTSVKELGTSRTYEGGERWRTST